MTTERIVQLGDFRRQSGELLTKLLEDLKSHNDEYTPGAQMGKALGRMLTSAMDTEEKPNIQKSQAEVLVESAQGGRTGLAELNTKHDAILKRFGLKLVHEASEGLKHGLPSGSVAMKIDNVHSFLRYAQSLPVETTGGEPSEAYKTLLNAVERQIANIHFDHPSPEERSVIENIEALHDSFQKISPSLDTSRLRNFAAFKNRLEQYLVAERAGLWKMPGKDFGPADWVRDAGPEWLDKKWTEALSVVKAQDALGDVGVGKELRAHLIMCIEKALEYLNASAYHANVKGQFVEILERSRIELEK